MLAVWGLPQESIDLGKAPGAHIAVRKGPNLDPKNTLNRKNRNAAQAKLARGPSTVKLVCVLQTIRYKCAFAFVPPSPLHGQAPPVANCVTRTFFIKSEKMVVPSPGWASVSTI